ncbi:MAG: WecB/TagA/CpsF family glycosyltransferase [Kiritimatiellae bacterium]|nr:WecB/TagA/CpsF family glycosyltransferase [Kiritimatiellia bacterium]
MRLLVSCVPYDGGKSGISVYVREVVRELAAQGHELTLLCEPGEELRLGRETLDDRRGKTSRLASDVPCQIPSISAPRWTRRPALSMLWHLFVLPFWIRRHRGDFDGFFICAANRRVCAFYPLPTAATVHDLANFHIPGKYSRLRMFYLAHVLPHYAKKAQRLVAVSGATKADMVKFWHCREDDVTVLYNGLSGRETLDARREGDSRPASRASRPGSLLYISRIEHPGKNHVRLIEAYSRLPRETAAAHPLVLAGADWKDAEIVHEAAKRSPNAAFIRFTGFVTGEKLAEVWAEAGLYVFPSLFEGFGLSLIEAMAQGIPCACSNNGSLGEIAGDVALTFDPESVDEIAAALARLLDESAAEREARIKRGFEWIKRFSWEDHAKGIVELIGGTLRHETMDEGRGQPARLASRVSCQEVSRLFGISVAKVTQSEAVERIVEFAKRRQGAAFVATLNVDFVANAVSGWPFGGNDELWGYLKDADLVTADGMPIVALSRILRQPLPERVTGADMVPAILRRCAEEGLSVYVLGGDRDAVEEAFEKSGCLGREMSDGRREESSRPASDVSSLKQPLRIAGIDPAFVKLDEPQPEIVERINAAKPDILFVALGNPKQELWMGRNKAKLDVGAMIGVGGTFNFLAGRVKRAPRWMQKSGLEWVYRIVQEPGRLWRRYAYGLVKYSWLSFRSLIGGYR